MRGSVDGGVGFDQRRLQIRLQRSLASIKETPNSGVEWSGVETPNSGVEWSGVESASASPLDVDVDVVAAYKVRDNVERLCMRHCVDDT
jgi:hypothetical protein